MAARHSIQHAHIDQKPLTFPTSTNNPYATRWQHDQKPNETTSTLTSNHEITSHSRPESVIRDDDYEDEAQGTLGRISSRNLIASRVDHHDQSSETFYSLDRQMSARRSSQLAGEISQHHVAALEAGTSTAPLYQVRPPEFTSLSKELSMPGIALCTLGPDLSFAAISVFVTSSVQKSYQGSASSVLVTVQNLASAIITSMADSIGVEVNSDAEGGIGLEGLRAIWYFGLGLSLISAIISGIFVRIPRAVEMEHAP